LAVVDDKVVIKIHLPYTDDSVTIQVNPSVQKYVEKPATNVRQMMITTPTSETTTLSLDLKTIGGSSSLPEREQSTKSNFEDFEARALTNV